MQRCALHVASCSLAVAAMSPVAHADSLVYGDFSARAVVNAEMRRDVLSPLEQSGADVTIHDPAQSLDEYHHLGNTGGTFPYITDYGWRSVSQYSTGFSEHALSRLWTGASGDETYLRGSNRVEIERTFTVIDGPGNDISCAFYYSVNGPYNTGAYGPDVNPIHARGVEFFLERIGGQVLVDEQLSSSGPTAQEPTHTFSIPAMQPLAPGEYRVRVASWAEWEATAQNGRGWSQSSMRFSVGVVPSPGPLAILGTGIAAMTWRRRVSTAK